MEMALPGPQLNVQAQYPQDHLSKFADLHLSSNPDLLLHPTPGQHYPAPMVEPRLGQGPRGTQTGQQSGRPMGTTAQVIPCSERSRFSLCTGTGWQVCWFSVLSHEAQGITEGLKFIWPHIEGLETGNFITHI